MTMSNIIDTGFSLEIPSNKCPQIIRCYGDDYTFEKGVHVYNLLLEYANGGSLADYVKNRKEKMSEIEIRSLTKSILKGLYYMHENGFVHCDIKLQNILLSDGLVKIADFRLSKKSGEDNGGLDFRGTLRYMSRESVAGGDYNFPRDIWALGCVVIEIAMGIPAWKGGVDENVAALLMRIKAGDELPEVPCMLSDEGKDFLSKCFVKDPLKRWTADMLLNHPFVACDKFPIFGDLSPRDPFELSDWKESLGFRLGLKSSRIDVNDLQLNWKEFSSLYMSLECSKIEVNDRPFECSDQKKNFRNILYRVLHD